MDFKLNDRVMCPYYVWDLGEEKEAENCSNDVIDYNAWKQHLIGWNTAAVFKMECLSFYLHICFQ